jgi:pimeloyl-ACP methyl ester carboxylesterase
MIDLRALLLSFALTAAATLPAARADEPSYGPELEGFAYPYPLHHFSFESQEKSLRMGYMDVPASGTPNGHTAALLHGKNFCAATWEDTIKALTGAGYRVIAPDQIGFCTSTKPDSYQYSFHQLAANTQALLAQLGVTRAILIGHSTGGMLATRYALLYPE